MSRVRLVLCVLMPFAAGYYLSYLFRSINALIARDLGAELGLGAGDLGLLTSVYFLVFAVIGLPCGTLLDRYGPRLVDSALLLVAATGAIVFALADGVWTLIAGRALIGLGVAVALISFHSGTSHSPMGSTSCSARSAPCPRPVPPRC